MVIYKEGDKSKGPCYNCNEIVPTTFRYANYKTKGLTIPNVMQGFCSRCHNAVSLPHQSSFRIKEYREKTSRKLDFRIPMHNTDILLALGNTYKVSPKPNLLFRILIELYLLRIAKHDAKSFRKKIINSLKDNLTKGKSKDRLTISCSDTIYSAFKELSEIGSQTSIAKAIIVMAKHDLLDNKNPTLSDEFKEIAAVNC
jgi:hypothetical protein